VQIWTRSDQGVARAAQQDAARARVAAREEGRPRASARCVAPSLSAATVKSAGPPFRRKGDGRTLSVEPERFVDERHARIPLFDLIVDLRREDGRFLFERIKPVRAPDESARSPIIVAWRASIQPPC
jgi:hypothetical protein